MIVVVLLLVLVLAGAFSPSSSSGGSSSGALSYKQARPIAASAIAGYQGGGWALLFAAGYAVNQTYNLPLNLSSSALAGSSCTFTPAPGVSSNVTLPGISGNLTSGYASGWVFAYRNGASDLALVEVASGHGTVVGTLSGSSCTSLFALLSTIPANAIDSTQAAAAVSVQSSAFRATYPNASALYGLIGGVNFLGLTMGPQWSVEYSTCPLLGASGATGTTFNATVDALNGTVAYYQTTSGVVCSSSTPSNTTPLGSVFAAALTSFSTRGATNLYNVTVYVATSGVTWADMIPQITDSTGTPITTPWYLTVTDLTGAPIAYYNSTTAAWAGGSSQAVSVTDGITISSPVILSTGDVLVFQGVGSYSGSVDVSL